MNDTNAARQDVPPWREMNSGVLRHAVGAEHLGTAEIAPSGDFEAGSHASIMLTYTAGTYGIDDSGALRICFRHASDQSPPQFDDPTAPNYTIVEALNGATLDCRFDPKGNVRPWDQTLYIKVVRGFLKEGDRIVVRFGVTDHGSPGMRMQTFCEESFEFRVLVDPIATANFEALPVQPTVRIVPGPPERYVAVLPTLRRAGQPFSLRIKGEDRWGNPSDRCADRFRLRALGQVEGLPETIAMEPGRFSAEAAHLVVREPGDLAIELLGEDGASLARSNPLRVAGDAGLVHFWGDLHGQTEETIGTNSIGDYFAFARDRAFLDACAHQGNDFQITAEFWAEINRTTAAFDAPGRYVTLPGYEWSGNTALGGDRNVFFPEEGRKIRRSSHALIEDRSDLETDCLTAGGLFETFARDREWDVVCFAHCGGRYADISLAHDGRFERSVEVHSAWGTFEWLLHDAFEAGYRVGVVANSDGHKGRPGASYPGAGRFGAIGGLTCYLMEELSREALLDCLRKRRHFGTTGGAGGRLLLDVRARFDCPADIYHDDPALGPATAHSAREALMGDIVHLPEGEVELEIAVLAAAPIERVDIFNGLEHLETVRPYSAGDLGRRIRVIWQGAADRGRARAVVWDGEARFGGNRIADARAINFLNRDKTLERRGQDGLAWRALTTGNFGGFDVWLEDGQAGRLDLSTPLVQFELPVSDIGLEDRVFAVSGALPRLVKAFRLPDANTSRTMRLSRRMPLGEAGDNPLYVRLTQEDGTLAWSSPIYVYRGAARP